MAFGRPSAVTTPDPPVAWVSAIIMAISIVLLVLLERLFGTERLFGGIR
jgi:hypothetical protein